MIKHGVAPFLECSSRGDSRFSAFYAKVFLYGKLSSIEDLYQAKKVFEDGITNLPWKQAKGKKAINMDECAIYYSRLWDLYIKQHPELIEVLTSATGLSDMFGQEGHCCQATELWRIRSKYVNISNV